MKIGIIAHLKHPIKIPFAGGLEAFTYQITEKLVERGHEVLLFASDSSDANLPLIPILKDENYNKKNGSRVKVKDLPSEYIAEHHAYQELMLTVDDYELDIIFNNCLHYVPITMANSIETPMLTVLHTPPFYELKLAIDAERKSKVIEYATVSSANANSWKNHTSNCTIIQNGIDLKNWEFYEKGRQENYAVWFGRIHPDKGLEYAIEAAKTAKIKLKVAGGISDERYYKNKIVPLLNDDIELLGLVDQKELNKLIGEANVCLVTPTWQEPFGLVVAEAMACGTPIAGFSMGALPEIVGKDTGVLVPFGDVKELTDAIYKASSLNRVEVRNYCEQNFDIEIMVDKYENLLNSCAFAKTANEQEHVEA